jgi:hypothetical protein
MSAALTLARPRDVPPRRRPAVPIVMALVAVLVGAALVVTALSSPPAATAPSNGPPAPAPTTAVAGTDGLWPGGPAAPLPVTVPGPPGTLRDVTAIVADLRGLPPACPPRHWVITPPRLPVRTSGDTVPLRVALTPDAPPGCQGHTPLVPVSTTVVAPDGTASSATALVPVAVAALGTPVVRPRDVDGTPGVHVTGAATGPAAAVITVDAVRPDGRRVPVCRTVRGTTCADVTAPAVIELSYQVTAQLGSWRRSAPPVVLRTPPPAPTVAPSGDHRLRVRAPAAAGAYEVAVVLDARPPVRMRVPAGAVLDGEVPLDGLSAGPHEAVVTTSAHGLRRSSGLRFGIRDGRVTIRS